MTGNLFVALSGNQTYTAVVPETWRKGGTFRQKLFYNICTIKLYTSKSIGVDWLDFEIVKLLRLKEMVRPWVELKFILRKGSHFSWKCKDTEYSQKREVGRRKRRKSTESLAGHWQFLSNHFGKITAPALFFLFLFWKTMSKVCKLTKFSIAADPKSAMRSSKIRTNKLRHGSLLSPLEEIIKKEKGEGKDQYGH